MVDDIQVSVPVIGIRDLADDGRALAELDAACRDWGFFQVVDHGVDDGLISSVHEQMRAFFALPRHEKTKILRTRTNVWGYYDHELTKNTPDWKEIFDVGPAEAEGPVAGAMPQWPDALPEFKAVLNAYIDACRNVANRLLAAIALNLSVPPSELTAAFGSDDSSFLRLNYYPLCADPAPADAETMPASGHLGINHHTDAGALTVLIQNDQPGLQVLRNGVWRLVEPRADALVINIGDIVQVWSNDRYTAPLHRVLANSERVRYSAAFFFNPSYETDYAPLPRLCNADSPPRYRPINWGRFRAGRAAGDYADYGKEIQISDFR
ncbi:MAG: 2-oxoglutarate and iron-dependent oxygenase domain-containing protein [Gammaproteobacteria bacterium]|nr:2-oxoglutarate and iron-dependent oxygenase domain-containing protein [Gammaproteobacteria bacterium]